MHFSFSGEHKIIEKELDELLEYSREFVQENHKADDNIAFSIVCGDFNMDNMSPGERYNVSLLTLQLGQSEFFNVCLCRFQHG